MYLSANNCKWRSVSQVRGNNVNLVTSKSEFSGGCEASISGPQNSDSSMFSHSGLCDVYQFTEDWWPLRLTR